MNILIEECLNEAYDNIPDWSDLASFIPGDNITQIIDERGNGEWQIQKITEASGAILNVDFFGVEFESLPEGTSAEDFFENIRRMLQEVDNTCFNQFEFNESLDTELWLSDNPLGTVFDIDILGPDQSNSRIIAENYRPDWDKVKKEILNRPVSEILSCVKN